MSQSLGFEVVAADDLEDVAAAGAVYERAVRAGRGLEVNLAA